MPWLARRTHKYWNANKKPSNILANRFQKCSRAPSKQAKNSSKDTKIHSKYSGKVRSQAITPQGHEKRTFLWLGLPWRRPYRPKNGPKSGSRIRQKWSSVLYAYWDQLLIEFDLARSTFWRLNLVTFHATFAALYAPRLIHDFRRMSAAFYMFLTIGNSSFWQQKCFVSITFL